MNQLITATPWAIVARWATHSQEQARRNAMASCTALAARRLERLEVEAFVAEQLRRRRSSDREQPAAPLVG